MRSARALLLAAALAAGAGAAHPAVEVRVLAAGARGPAGPRTPHTH